MNDPRSRLPPVNDLVTEARAAGIDSATRGELVAAIRSVLEDARAVGGSSPALGWVPTIEQRLNEASRLSLRRVINATGVVLHTNLGRAPLAVLARQAMEQAAGYSTLEYDLEVGERGSRHDHSRDLLRDLTGADDALVVNKAARALLLVLHAFGANGESIVSRGELVEIGGAFRIPDILARSGTALIEVGTTNRTRIRDYELAISPRTKLFLKVHRSNFSVRGFTSEATVEELVELGSAREIPTVHDAGSGLLMSLDDVGLRGEPLVTESVKAGATTVFSGDKLLGGPQCGIVVGRAAAMATVASNPLARALRPDKMVLAALEATLTLYRDPERARRDVPILSMLTADPAVLKRRARRLAKRIPGSSTIAGQSAVGGGAFPTAELPTTLVVVQVDSAERALALLRRGNPPIIARTLEDTIAFDPRTIRDEEFPQVAAAAIAVMEQTRR